MKIVLEITPHHNEDSKFYRTIEWEPVKLGRGYGNNIIINDPYLDAEHVEIFRDGADVFIEDLNSVNGVKINNKRRDISKLSVGDEVLLGTTKIRVLSPTMEVPAALKIIDKRFIMNWIEKASSAWVSLVLMIAIMKLWTYNELWPRAEHDLVDIMVIASSVGAVIVWSLLWSVASRLIRYKAHFKCHITISSLYMIFSVFIWYLQSYVMFLSSDSIVSDIFNYSVNFALLSSLIYASLAFASNMNHAKNFVFATLFAGSIVCGMLSIDYISSFKFSLKPHYSASMEAYLSDYVRVQGLEEFMADNKKLFASKTLNKIKK